MFTSARARSWFTQSATRAPPALGHRAFAREIPGFVKLQLPSSLHKLRPMRLVVPGDLLVGRRRRGQEALIEIGGNPQIVLHAIAEAPFGQCVRLERLAVRRVGGETGAQLQQPLVDCVGGGQRRSVAVHLR